MDGQESLGRRVAELQLLTSLEAASGILFFMHVNAPLSYPALLLMRSPPLIHLSRFVIATLVTGRDELMLYGAATS